MRFYVSPHPIISFFSYSSLLTNLACYTWQFLLEFNLCTHWRCPFQVFSFVFSCTLCIFFSHLPCYSQDLSFLLLLYFSLKHLVVYFPPDSQCFPRAYSCIGFLMRVVYWFHWVLHHHRGKRVGERVFPKHCYKRCYSLKYIHLQQFCLCQYSVSQTIEYLGFWNRNNIDN